MWYLLAVLCVFSILGLPSPITADTCNQSSYDPRSYQGEVAPSDKPHINFEFVSDIEEYPDGKVERYTCVANRHPSEPLIVIWEKGLIIHTIWNRLAPNTADPRAQEIKSYHANPDQHAPILYTQILINQPASLYLTPSLAFLDGSDDNITLRSHMKTTIINSMGEEQDVEIRITSTFENGVITNTIQHAPRSMAIALGTLSEHLAERDRSDLDEQMKLQGQIVEFALLKDFMLPKQAKEIPETLLEASVVLFTDQDLEDAPEIISFDMDAQEVRSVPAMVVGLTKEGYLLSTGEATLLLRRE